ncbi:hypothetical protein MTR67_050555 [Solanum verrucosum]|uniref:MADS-box domain-containing protein n=1 Tax=Solanum verrucosum TaxID=315347 RepID=A0AAF1A1N4_SOLVR|nr:hypothetical protein MTR67_050555 [Solanum verrucosum]
MVTGRSNGDENFWKIIIRLGLRKSRMGRRKLEIKRIESKSNRQMSFCKRSKGLMKKAKEISILCDVDVAVVLISNRGKLHEFSSTNSLYVSRYGALFPCLPTIPTLVV